MIEPATETRGAILDPPVLLSVDDLHVSYAGGLPVLRGVCLTVGEGGVVAILGSNGAGKTTLLRAVTGLLRGQGGTVTGGNVTFAGQRSRGDAGQLVRAGMAQVMEGRRLFRDLTVEENLHLGAASVGQATTRRQLLKAQYERFPMLVDKRDTQAGLLSGGQQQVVAIARALMSAPRLLVLDEPSLGLSPRAVGEVRDLLVEVNRNGTTVLLVEQNARMALSIADRGYLVERGRIAHSGTPQDLRDAGAISQLTSTGDATIVRSEPALIPAKDLPWLR